MGFEVQPQASAAKSEQLGINLLTINEPTEHDTGSQSPPNSSTTTRDLRSSSVSSNASSNGTPRRRTYHIAPVSLGSSGPKRSPRPSISESSPVRDPQAQEDEVALYMSRLATKEARVNELREQMKGLQLELQAAEFDLQTFKKSGDKLAQHLRNPRRSLARASTADLQKNIRVNISRSPSPKREIRSPQQQSQVKRVVGEIGTQFWSFVEDVRTAALGEEDEWEKSTKMKGKRGDREDKHSETAPKSPQRHRDPDPNQYL